MRRRRIRGNRALLVTATLAAIAWAVRALLVPGLTTTASGVVVGRLPPGIRPSDLNLLLITLDTTRADRMGAYGGKATPAFDRIAREGVLFQHAITAAPLTLPAHATLFTGRFPPGHGVRDNGGFFLDGKETTLAERLKSKGFVTGGFVGAFVLDRRWGIAQGFDAYFDEFELPRAVASGAARVERRADEVADRALAWLDTASSSRFFGWLHFYDAHSPYEPPEPYRSRFADDPYAGEIAFADAQAARVIDFLERRDLLKKTVVVIIADHGESLGEHGESTHGFFVYQSVLEVPFAILAPFDGLRGRMVRDVVRSVDVAATVLDLLAIPQSDPLDGRSLVPLMTGAVSSPAPGAYAESMYPRYHFGWSELRALTDGRFKYIEAPRPELYDLQLDPGETKNLYDERRPLGDQMRSSLRDIAQPASAAARPAVEVSADARARLGALGYIGTFAGDAPRERSSLANPGDKIELFNAITQARERLQTPDGAAAGLEMLEQVVRKDSEIVDAWLLIGNEYARRRNFGRARQGFERALALKPDYDVAAMNLANVYRDLRRPSDAVAVLRRLLEITPDNLQVRQQMAQILLDERQLADAERELTRVLEQDAHMAAARNSLGALRLEQGETDAGEREIRAALAQQPALPLAHFNLAIVAERRSDLATAEIEYRKEIQDHPDAYRAQFNLGRLYERRGDRAAQLRAFQDAVESNPGFTEGHLFLAKLYLDLRRFEEAMRSARRGLELEPAGEWAALGHFVLADAFDAKGLHEAAAREAAEGRRLAARRSAKPDEHR